MNQGTQVIAPDGLAQLKAGVRYSFLKLDLDSGWATFAEFTTQEHGRRVHIHRIESSLYQEAKQDDRLNVPEHQHHLPPWLATIEGASLDEIDLQRVDAVMPHRTRTEHRYAFIVDLIPRTNEILAAVNPFSIINAHAKALTPQQNRERLAEWYFAFISYGRKLIALYPEYPNVGTYDKADEKYNATHFGPVSADKGKHYGWPSAMFKEEIKKSVEKRLHTGWTKIAIYEDALQKDFGCRGSINERGDWVLCHPEGKPFPDTYGKFWYRWNKEFDLKKTDLALYGKHRDRARAASKGSYAEEVGAFMSEMEVDAYFLKERPQVIDGEDASNRLCVARAVCVASKYVGGIGFSCESEKEDTYGTMLFSAAIGLIATGELWGLKASDLLPAPFKGLPPQAISDRGSAPKAAIINNLAAQFPIKELTETYSGQSKPSVEAGHPRDMKNVGPPVHAVSDKNVIQLIQREICRAALDNHSSYVGDLIIGSRATDETVTSPYGLATWLDKQGLNDAIGMIEVDAARAFLPRVTYEIRDGGFWFQTRCYSSTEMAATGIYDELNPGQRIEVNGYHWPMNLMWAWVEFRGKLFRLKQKMPVRMGEQEQMLSMEEISREVETKKQLDAEHPRSATAAEVEAHARYENATGVSWGNTKKKAGHPKKSPEAAVERKILSPKANRRPRKAA